MDCRRSTARFGAVLLLTGSISAGQAEALQRFAFDVPPQELKYALRAITRQSGLELFANARDLRGRTSLPIHATLSPEEALDRLLDGSGLEAHIEGTAVFIRGRDKAVATPTANPGGDIVVTGTRIRGAPATYPLTSVSRETMRDRGQNDLGEVIRSLPQNFSGGQNPGVGFGVPGSENVSSGSSLDLRGLGPDATLTLVNGHRIAYDSVTQSIDVSAIPVAALERLEIVPDGASALYGSDAVGGVANIILRRDFSGVDSRIRIASSTEGGGFQQDYDLVAGTRWESGGVIATADIGWTTKIAAADRTITSDVPGDTTLDPSQRVQSFVVSGHQNVFGKAELVLDSFYTHRSSFTTSTYALPDVLAYGSTFHTDLASYAIAPKLSVPVGAWHAELQGVHGGDKVETRTDYYFGGESIGTFPVDYANRLDSFEISAEGPVIDLPAGALRLAAGGGYRSVGLHGTTQSIVDGAVASDVEFRGHKHTSYGYGEIFIPLVGQPNAHTALHRLNLTIAGRLEHDPEYGSVFTPKVGVEYEPGRDIGFEASWGRSFKEPTLFQLSTTPGVTLARASDFAQGYPETATVLVRNGGNPDLKPERARTWSATLKLHPAAVPGLHLSASYFDIRYKNRILTPITDEDGALSNPLYANVVQLQPAPGDAQSIVSSAAGGLTNNAGQPFDPNDVIAVVDNRYHNLSRFNARGVDLAIDATITLADGSRLTPSGSASYLKSSQVDLPGGEALQRAGTLYNPPHWRARLDAPWRKGALTLAPAINLIGGVTSHASTGDVRVRGMTTCDVTLRYVAPVAAPVRGLEVDFSVLNVGNRMPGRIPVSDFFYPPFDSANYSSQGRLVALTIGKRW